MYTIEVAAQTRPHKQTTTHTAWLCHCRQMFTHNITCVCTNRYTQHYATHMNTHTHTFKYTHRTWHIAWAMSCQLSSETKSFPPGLSTPTHNINPVLCWDQTHRDTHTCRHTHIIESAHTLPHTCTSAPTFLFSVATVSVTGQNERRKWYHHELTDTKWKEHEYVWGENEVVGGTEGCRREGGMGKGSAGIRVCQRTESGHWILHSAWPIEIHQWVKRFQFNSEVCGLSIVTVTLFVGRHMPV